MEESRNRSKDGSKGGSDDDDVGDGSKGGSDDDDVGQGELYSPAYSINVRNNKANLDANVGQGELYSPSHAIKVSNNKANQEPSSLLPSSMGLGVAADHIRWNLGAIKDRLLEKLAAAAVPADALDSARHFLESVVKDVTGAAHGITKDALHRVRTLLTFYPPCLLKPRTRWWMRQKGKLIILVEVLGEKMRGRTRKDAKEVEFERSPMPRPLPLCFLHQGFDASLYLNNTMSE